MEGIGKMHAESPEPKGPVDYGSFEPAGGDAHSEVLPLTPSPDSALDAHVPSHEETGAVQELPESVASRPGGDDRINALCSLVRRRLYSADVSNPEPRQAVGNAQAVEQLAQRFVAGQSVRFTTQEYESYSVHMGAISRYEGADGTVSPASVWVNTEGPLLPDAYAPDESPLLYVMATTYTAQPEGLVVSVMQEVRSVDRCLWGDFSQIGATSIEEVTLLSALFDAIE